MKQLKLLHIKFRIILVTLLLATTLAAVSGCNKTSDTYVYVTKYGEKYHDINCYYIKDNYKKLTLEDAKDQGYSKCSKCW